MRAFRGLWPCLRQKDACLFFRPGLSPEEGRQRPRTNSRQKEDVCRLIQPGLSPDEGCQRLPAVSAAEGCLLASSAGAEPREEGCQGPWPRLHQEDTGLLFLD